MKNLPRITLERFRQAWQSLMSNKLRSFYSPTYQAAKMTSVVAMRD